VISKLKSKLFSKSNWFKLSNQTRNHDFKNCPNGPPYGTPLWHGIWLTCIWSKISKIFLKNQIAMIIFKIVLKIIFTNIDIFKIKPKNKIKKIFKIFLDVKWKTKFTQLLGISCLGIWWQVCELLTGTAADEQTLILRSTQQSVIRIDYSHNLLPRQHIRCVWCEPGCCLPRI
jgi:hypothetical protein